jgi:hypothetical protein
LATAFHVALPEASDVSALFAAGAPPVKVIVDAVTTPVADITTASAPEEAFPALDAGRTANEPPDPI